MTEVWISQFSPSGFVRHRLDVPEFDIEMTFTLTDGTDRISASTPYSKTITIPATSNNLRAFGGIGGLNSFSSFFSPTLFTDCWVWADGIQVFSGLFRVIQATIQNGETFYECSITGYETEAFMLFGQTYLTSLEWNDYDHVRETAFIESIVTDPISSNVANGYCYAALDSYGYTDAVQQSQVVGGGGNTILQKIPFWRLFPCLSLRAVMDIIHTQLGYRWNSAFFSSTNMLNKIVIPYPNDAFPGANVPELNCMVAMDQYTDLRLSNTAYWTYGSYYDPVQNVTMNAWWVRPPFMWNSPAPLYDDLAGIWPTSLWDVLDYNTAELPGSTAFTWNMTYKAWNANGVAAPFVTWVTWNYVDPNDPTGFYPMPQSLSGNPVFQLCAGGPVEAPVTTQCSFTGQLIVPPQTKVYPVIWLYYYAAATYDENLIKIINPEQAVMNINGHNTLFGPVEGVQMVPKNLTALDFISDLQKTFNLRISVSKSTTFGDQRPTIQYEPYNWYYNVGGVASAVAPLPPALDWLKKIDANGLIKIRPGDVTSKRKYVFKNKSANDRLSIEHRQDIGREYGERIYLTNNDFAKDTQEVVTTYGNLPIASFGWDFITGRTWDVDGSSNFVQKMPGYRWAFVKGVRLPNDQYWHYVVDGTTFIRYNFYPYIGHLDDPFDPTMDLNFGMPGEVYFSLYDYGNPPGSINVINAKMTTNNSFNQYYYAMIEEIASTNAMEIEVDVYLTAGDIAMLDFRAPIFYNGILWRLISLTGVVLGSTKPCRAVLRRVLYKANSIPGIYVTGQVNVLRQDTFDTTSYDVFDLNKEYRPKQLALKAGWVRPSRDLPIEPTFYNIPY